MREAAHFWVVAGARGGWAARRLILGLCVSYVIFSPLGGSNAT